MSYPTLHPFPASARSNGLEEGVDPDDAQIVDEEDADLEDDADDEDDSDDEDDVDDDDDDDDETAGDEGIDDPS